MKYTIINKLTGDTPSSVKPMSLTQLMGLIDRFMQFNTEKKFKNSTDKISYYNKNSFYIVKELV